MRSLKSTMKYFGIAAVAVAAAFPSLAQAGFFENLVSTVLGLILMPLYAIFMALIALELKIVEALVDPSVIRFTTNPMVVEGWRYLRDIVNLGLVLAIMIIAIGFILRIQTYGSQRTLMRLIIVAILVNFSLAIAGIFIDVAAILTNTILREVNVRNYFYAATGLTRLQGYNNYSRLMEDIDANSSTSARAVITDEVTGPAKAVLRHVMLILFSVILVVALGAFMIMLVIRIARLWLYLILAPLAWLSWIFPSSESYWRRWWHEFLNWTFFAPFVLFFLAFALRLACGSQSGTNPTTCTLPFGVRENFTSMVAQYVVGIALIIVALMLAQQSGVAFASTAIGATTAIARWPGLTAWRASVRESSGRFATSTLGKFFEERFAHSRIPGVGRWADTLSAIRTRVEYEAKKVAERKKILASSQIREDLENPRKRALMSQADLLGGAIVLNDRGEQLPESVANIVLQVAHNANPKLAEQFLAMNPLLVAQYEAEIARRSEAQRRSLADYARRITTEQAENFRINTLEELSAADRALFASGMQQSVLAHMLEKNYESGELLLNTLRNTAELQNQLRAAGRQEQEIRSTVARIQRMLKSPQLAYWTGEGGESRTSVRQYVPE